MAIPAHVPVWELVPNWYKAFPPDHYGREEIEKDNQVE